MSSVTPEIFSNMRFWMAVMAVIVVINYFWGKPAPEPKSSKFFEKHKKTITRVTDIFLLLALAFCWIPTLYMSGHMALRALLENSEYPLSLKEELTSALAIFCTTAVFMSGYSGFLIGFLSVFQSNLTRAKRIFLATISFLPLIFMGLLLWLSPAENSQDLWTIVKAGINSAMVCWIFNGPAIIIGKHFLPVTWNIMRKIRWVSGDYPG